MRDIELYNDGRIVFCKKLWHDSEITLAKCYNFSVDFETGTIIAMVGLTFKKSIYHFIKLSFKSFSEALDNEARRNDFYSRLDAMYELKDNSVTEIMKVNLPYYDKFYQHQKDTLMQSFYHKHFFGALDMGLGKAQPIDSKIYTPYGRSEMGDLKVGMKVIGSDGLPCTVMGVYPQGKIPYFRVHFSDNTYTECCDDHLWICRPINLDKKWDWRVKPLKELRNDLVYKTKERDLSKWAIPKTNPVQFNFSDPLTKPIHPYLLGILLGDGCLINTVSLSTNDHDELIPIIRDMLPEGMVIKKQDADNYTWNICHNSNRGSGSNELINQIRFLGLFGKKSHEKFVPTQYLYTSIQERIELLQGLLDTDGHVSKKGSRLSMTTTSPMIKDAIVFLTQSLGGTATFGEDEREDKRLCYYVNINLPNNITPFKLSRRLKRYNPKQRLLARKIVSVEYMGETECQCIKVDSKDSSYLTDNFIVTHNTAISASISRMMQAECTLIVCPAAVKWNWFRDLTSKLWGFNELFFTILDRTKRRTITALNERFIIVNYDIIGNYEKYFATKNVRHIIFDESHYLKNHNSLRYKAVKKIVDLFPEARITFLSGTPVANRVNDIFAYLKLINHELGHSHKKFISEFTVTTSGRGGERVTGGKNLQDLNIKLANFMIRKTKEECLDLPGKIFLSYRFELDDYRDEYDKIIEEMSQRKEFKNLNSDLHSLNILTSKAKLPGIKELAETIIESGKKVVIFGSYREPINELQEYFKERCVKIDGSVDSFTRDQHIQKFHNDPECVVFLGNMRAAGVGINLTNASDVIFVNFPFTVAELYQATDRCDRIGQKFAVNVHYTFCDESIDEYIYEIIVDKEKDINALIDQGKEAVLRENTTEILIKKLLNRKNLDDIDYTDYTPIEEFDGEEETIHGLEEQIHSGDRPDTRESEVTRNDVFGERNEVDRTSSGGLQQGAHKEDVVLPTSSSISESFEDMQQLVQHMNDNGSQFIPNEPKGVVTDDMVKKSWEHLEKNKVKAPGHQITLEEGIEEAEKQSFVVNQPPPTFTLPDFD